ncbi:AhpC/TSA family protein [Kribbella pittospori]|uniref:thioredoxin-dependent peroxiredoxin n=2 Tax=Kribbella pittospori TaxID=722689 RepID=A0A4R0JSR5_9ACTN|nr:AhpC/TSA family protein [Kribbella pittospori]
MPAGQFDLTKELGRWRELRDLAIPDDVAAAMDRATVALAASGLGGEIVSVGSRAPGFVLANAAGDKVSLEDLLARGPVVISFYRGVWCPFCNLEQRALQQALPQIVEHGAALVAISGMTPTNSTAMIEQNGLTYEVLTDPGLLVARSYGLVFELPEYLRQAYARLGHPIPRYNGTTEHTLPVPATFVVDSAGVIRFAYAVPNYMYRADPAHVIAALAALPT